MGKKNSSRKNFNVSFLKKTVVKGAEKVPIRNIGDYKKFGSKSMYRLPRYRDESDWF